MNFTTVQAQLNDLPPTFKRPNAPYLQLIDAFSSALYRYTQSARGTTQQLKFTAAQYGWADVWGLLFGIPRFANEADSHYLTRIMFSVLAGAGPPLQIQKWIQVVWGITATVTENLPAVGYSITFPNVVTSAQITQILASLAYIRPAGVPITSVASQTLGTSLETINFYNAPEVIGGFLTGAGLATAYNLSATTNNSLPLLPGLFLTDPGLNPLLAA